MKVDIITFSDISIDPRPMRQVELFANKNYELNVYCIGNIFSKDFGKNTQIHSLFVSRKKKNLLENFKNYIYFFLFLVWHLNIKGSKRVRSLTLFNNMPNFLVFSTLFNRRIHRNVVLDVHDSLLDIYSARNANKKKSFINKIFLKLLKFEEKSSFNFVNKVITVNRVIGNDLKKRTNLKDISIIHNVQDNYLSYADIKDDYFFDKHNLNFVHHGNINEHNGIQNFLRYFARLGPQTTLTIIGDGIYLEKIKQLCMSSNIQHRVSFLGAFKMVDLPNLLPINPIAVVTPLSDPQLNQALHVKVLDYAILGIPVICRRLDALYEYFRDDSIFFYDDEKEIQEVIKKICSDPKRVFQNTKRAQKIVKELSWDLEKNNLIKLVNS